MAALPLTTIISQDGSTRRRNYRVLSAQYGDGYSQEARDGINNVVDEWTVHYPNLVQADRDNLVAFLDSNGASVSWTWTAPGDSGSKNWKLTKDGWSETFLAGNVYSITFNARQVF
jgi:phage-related protein